MALPSPTDVACTSPLHMSGRIKIPMTRVAWRTMITISVLLFMASYFQRFICSTESASHRCLCFCWRKRTTAASCIYRSALRSQDIEFCKLQDGNGTIFIVFLVWMLVKQVYESWPGIEMWNGLCSLSCIAMWFIALLYCYIVRSSYRMLVRHRLAQIESKLITQKRKGVSWL